MTPFKRGDVILIAFPFTDLTTTKMRPGVIVSSDRFNKKYEDIVVAAITSQVPKSLSNDDFSLSHTDQADAGLPKASIVKLGKIVTLDQRFVRKKLGRIPEETLFRLTSALHELLK